MKLTFEQIKTAFKYRGACSTAYIRRSLVLDNPPWRGVLKTCHVREACREYERQGLMTSRHFGNSIDWRLK